MRDIWVPCDTCHGKRYQTAINNFKLLLGSHDQHYSIGDLLELSANELLPLFEDKKLSDLLQILVDIGIGHLKLGQAGNTLSGGEAQRLKLAKALSDQGGQNLYLFDEPCSGLHQQDLSQLIAIFNRLISKGHTIIFIEHHSALIDIAHQQVKLGPGSGPAGGMLV